MIPLKIRLVCTLWGEPFVDLFLRVAVRSLVAPGNAADIARAYPARLSIVTTGTDADRIRSSAAFGLLAATLPVDFTIVGPLDADLSDNGSHALLWRAAMDESRRSGETIVFIIPDVFYPRGTLMRWVGRLAGGAAAVFSPSLQVVSETTLPELERRFPDPARPVDLDAAEAGVLGLRHLHPLWIAHVRGSPRASFLPEYLMRVVGGGVSIRMLALFPFCVDPRRAGIDAGTTRPDAAVPIACEPSIVLSLEPAFKQLNRLFRATSLDEDAMTGLGGWLDTAGALEHPAIGIDFAVPEGLAPDRSKQASSGAASFFVTQARLSRRIHRVWRAMHRLGCHEAGRVFAAAHFALPLRRRWRHRGPITVLVPHDTIRDRSAWAAVRGTLAIGQESALAALIDGHVVLGDVVLRPGVRYTPAESAAGPADSNSFTTAAGARFEASGGSSSGPPFQVLGHLIADGISVYAIDRVLSPSDEALPRRGPRSTPRIAHRTETSVALDSWLERLRRQGEDTRHHRTWRRVATVVRWIYREVLVSRPPLARRILVRMTRSQLGDRERRRLDEAFTILGLHELSVLAGFHETMGVHGTGMSPLRSQLEQAAESHRLWPADAERRLREVVAARPDVAEAWLGLGYLAADRGAVDAAIECFDHAVSGRPYLVPGSQTLLPAAVAAGAKGRLLEQAGRLEEAEASYAAAVAAGAKNDVCRRYARLLRARGALDDACTYFDRAVPWDDRSHPFPVLPRLFDDIVGAFESRDDTAGGPPLGTNDPLRDRVGTP